MNNNYPKIQEPFSLDFKKCRFLNKGFTLAEKNTKMTIAVKDSTDVVAKECLKK